MTAGKLLVAVLFITFTLVSVCSAQRNKSQLQREKQKNLEKIKETERILGETTNKKKKLRNLVLIIV